MITKASIRDLESIDRLTMMIIHDMKNSLIPQWNFPYPRYKVFMKDWMLGGLYVEKNGHHIDGSITLLKENDPPYKELDTWQGSNSLVIHRFMVDPLKRKQGIASKLLNYAYKLAIQEGYDSIKIDTHAKNYKMRSFLNKHGFLEKGYLASIDRIAYEKVLEESK
jgi:GNAT superfamily N-acetyltransferase